MAPTETAPERLRSICPECGEPFTRQAGAGASCAECKPIPTTGTRQARERERGTRRERGYDNAWLRLSARARKLQPFCSECGATDDLTADHSAEAWRRKEAGKVIRLKDIDVLCRRCNSERGDPRDIDGCHPRRGGEGLALSAKNPLGKAEYQ